MSHFYTSGGQAQLRLAFSQLTPEQIETGLDPVRGPGQNGPAVAPRDHGLLPEDFRHYHRGAHPGSMALLVLPVLGGARWPTGRMT
jgi:hypothetical protein